MPKTAKKVAETREVWWKCLHCEREVHNHSLEAPRMKKCPKAGTGEHFFMRAVKKAKTMDFDLTPSERKRCETFGRALYESLGDRITPVSARGNLLGAAMAAVGAGVPRKVFLSACAEEYDIFDKKKKVKKAVKRKSAKKT